MSASEFTVTGWHNGTRGWGLRVGKEGHRIFQRHRCRLDREALVVVLPGVSARLHVCLSESFWGKCPEVRAAEIGRWMRSRGEACWQKQERKPPKYSASLTVGHEVVLNVLKVVD